MPVYHYAIATYAGTNVLDLCAILETIFRLCLYSENVTSVKVAAMGYYKYRYCGFKKILLFVVIMYYSVITISL